jgi:ABC-type lipoprotein release transport system permease subunit
MMFGLDKTTNVRERSRRYKGVAYGAAKFDVRFAALVAAVLFAASLIASFVPALRSRSVNPNVLLRDS